MIAGLPVSHIFYVRIGGAVVAPSANPTCTLIRDGADTAVAVTVTGRPDGGWLAQATIPAGWTTGQQVALGVSATVTGYAGSVVETFELGMVEVEPRPANITQVNGAPVTLADLQGSAASITVDDIVAGLVAQGSTIKVVSPLSDDGKWLDITIGETLEFTVTKAFPANWTRIEWTIKDRIDRPNDQAIMRAVHYADATPSGLEVLNKAPVTLPNTNVVITTDQPNNSSTYKLLDNITVLLEQAEKLYFDIKWLDANSDSGRITSGQCRIGYTASSGG